MRRFLVSITILGLLVAMCGVVGCRSADNSNSGEADGTSVYITRTGAKYHRGSCSYLRQSRIAVTLSEAKASYNPCSRCKPPQ